MQIDDDLSGRSIVKETIKKANTRLKFLYRNKNILNFECRKTLCSALIQCHFDYSCSSWYPGINKGLKDKLQTTQNKMIRFILIIELILATNSKALGREEVDSDLSYHLSVFGGATGVCFG